MGNNACCEEESKGGEFVPHKPKFQPNKIHIEPSKLNTVNFGEQSRDVKTVFLEPRPDGKREMIKEWELKQIEQKIEERASEQDELPLTSKKQIQSRVKDNQQSDLLIYRGHESPSKPKEEQSEVRQERSQSKEEIVVEEENEKAEINMDEPHKQDQENIQIQTEKVELLAPALTDPVKQTLHAENFFSQEFTHFSPDYKRYDNEFYEGQLDQSGRFPDGLGKLYKHDSSLFIGHFQKGKASGKGVFIFPDGSYYSGDFKDNFAQAKHGIFKSKAFNYQGEFKKNKFHGKGTEVGSTHRFQGEYYDGNKTYGKLTWREKSGDYEYFGSFNNNHFNGEGTLKEPTGTYKGEFINGKKHGYGVYNFANGLRYQGEYKEGVRHGKGALINPNNKVAYQGDFQRGMPHGQGIVLDASGRKQTTKWVQGIDSTLL